MKKIIVGLGVIIFVLLVFPIENSIAISKKLTFSELTEEANVIILGKVLEVSCKCSEGSKKIYTYVTIIVEKTIKGPSNDKITVKILGGKVGGKVMKVFGMPEFRKGEEICLFLKSDESLYCPIVGWSQGKFNIEKDKNGERMVVDSKGNSPPGFEEEISEKNKYQEISLGEVIKQFQRMDKGSENLYMDKFTKGIQILINSCKN